MPRGDRTGPAGMGPMTGRASGFCAGFQSPGFMNRGGGRGFRGQCGQGAGRGWRNRFCAPAYQVDMPQGSTKNELGYLKEQAQYLKESLDNINKRVAELQKESGE